MAQLEKCLLHESEGLSSEPQDPHPKPGVVAQLLLSSKGVGRDRQTPETHLPDNLP